MPEILVRIQEVLIIVFIIIVITSHKARNYLFWQIGISRLEDFNLFNVVGTKFTFIKNLCKISIKRHYLLILIYETMHKNILSQPHTQPQSLQKHPVHICPHSFPCSKNNLLTYISIHVRLFPFSAFFVCLFVQVWTHSIKTCFCQLHYFLDKI